MEPDINKPNDKNKNENNNNKNNNNNNSSRLIIDTFNIKYAENTIRISE